MKQLEIFSAAREEHCDQTLLLTFALPIGIFTSDDGPLFAASNHLHIQETAMKLSFCYIAIGLALLFAGCVQSLCPLFNAKDCIFNPKLIGTWPDQGSDTWTFKKADGNLYTVIHYQHKYGIDFGGGKSTEGDSAFFEGRLGQLGGRLFLDLYPQIPGGGISKVKNDFFNWHFIPVHSIMKVWFVDDSLRYALLDNKWLREMIDKKAVTIAHARIEDQIILTAQPEDLQNLVQRYADDKNAFLPPEEIGHRYH